MDNRVPSGGHGWQLSAAATWPIRSGVVPALASGFVARQESAAGLAQMLAPGTTVALTPARTAAPEQPDWPGSSGKTQLAIFHAESLWRAGELDLLVWVTASNRAAILTGYAAAAAAAIGVHPSTEAEAVAVRFISWLSETSRRWLVVLDGLAGPWDMGGLWPFGPVGRTLITTAESAALFGQDHVLPFPVGGLSRREALSYLLGRLTEDRGQRAGAIDLVDQVSGEALALAQASGFIESSSLSCRDYLEHFVRKRATLAAASHRQPAISAITWTLSVEQAYRLLPGGPVQSLLILAAVLDGRWIPGTIFTTAATAEYAGAGSRSPARPADLWTCVLGLAHAGLLTVDSADTPPIIRMSSAVQTAIRRATSRELLDRAAVAAADALLEAWPDEDEPGWLADSLRSCAASVIDAAGDLLWTGKCYRLLFRLGQSMQEARLTRLAAAHWTEVAAASEQFLGLGHPDSIEAADQLAAAFLATGRAADALPWFRAVLDDRFAHLGPGHPSTLTAEISLGRALTTTGRASEAIPVLERAVSDCLHILGADQADTLNARDALAGACCGAGQLADGIRHYLRTLADRERLLGQTHPATMETELKLGDAYLAAERFKDALSQYKKVVSSRERTLGKDHPDTITAKARLASASHAAGRMAAALRLYEDACADGQRVLGADHPTTLALRVGIAHAYYSAGRLADAATVLRDAVERCERVLPPEDQLTQTARDALVNITGS